MAFRGTSITPFVDSTFPLFGLRREIDRLFDHVTTFSGMRWSPAVDVREDAKALSVDVELPGVKPSDVEVTVENNVLTISGEKRTERQEGEEGGRYHAVERTYGSFFRSFQLPQGIDESQITADFHDGILTVRIPKTALPQPRRIRIGSPASDKEVKAEPARETAG